ncbi:hypothetical protein A1Q2_05653 [Trichosporon asahii var. asahii CBS 8904]|uniref:Uncharacterized protein n=2 Tax=Trichosporon asahii var. asahii TaxID=189963 RepID=K1VGW8_TRIAC|nr:hypothetical protein A1Q1_03103 [Trichosporon asahii var. asahii CBS 2479]EJT52649.1 hypothetical protein A1Q1_03103 [Trichosporon asahii var. asahii CBS 2479]EKD00061.1 hypothetical protein A1Q2_05653 [Trichosporon asahii var. asahii CBS 8904]
MASNDGNPPPCGAPQPYPSAAFGLTPSASDASSPSPTASTTSTIKVTAIPPVYPQPAKLQSAPHRQCGLSASEATPLQLTVDALKAHDKRCERHSVRQAIRYGQRPAHKPKSKPPKSHVIRRLEGEFRDAAAETIYGLESALSAMQDQHARLEVVNARLHAQVTELQSRNHILAGTITYERAARHHAESKAIVQERAMQAEVDYLRRSLASTGKEGLRSHRTISPKAQPETTQTVVRPQLPPPWHPGNDDGVDHGDIYSDTLAAFLTHGAMPTSNWTTNP